MGFFRVPNHFNKLLGGDFSRLLFAGILQGLLLSLAGTLQSFPSLFGFGLVEPTAKKHQPAFPTTKKSPFGLLLGTSLAAFCSSFRCFSAASCSRVLGDQFVGGVGGGRRDRLLLGFLLTFLLISGFLLLVFAVILFPLSA